ncbi:TetR/AcrR family transcriptional regulator [Roseibium algae]|uniref:TetR/AcrR family transcriptional regulator n=1 Tax=Roseibium algae TaxID=3123038 RepID=A0ABU8THR9_9HYPH
MPYTSVHKEETRLRIVEAARMLFNLHGFNGVSIDMVMAKAGLTRGGFYNHFKNKEALFSAAVSGFLMGRGAQWRAEAGIDQTCPEGLMAQRMIDSYLSSKHLGDMENQCPMIALPSDVARSSQDVQSAYQELLTAMVGLFEKSLSDKDTSSNHDEEKASESAAQTPENGNLKDAPNSAEEIRQQALSLAALCVGGMVLARTLPGSRLAEDLRMAAHATARRMASGAPTA